METLVVRRRKLGYTTTICPFDEDYKHQYVIETRSKKWQIAAGTQKQISTLWEINKETGECKSCDHKLLKCLYSSQFDSGCKQCYRK